jgi:hypothetical protein
MDGKGAPLAGRLPTEPPGSPPGGISSFPPTIRRRVALTLEDTVPLWDVFRSGGTPTCPAGDGSLALSVDDANAYRLVCTQCGSASPWFEVASTGLRDRATPPPVAEDPTSL